MTDTRRGLKKGHPTTPIESTVKPSHRKGIKSAKTSFVRSIVSEVAGVAPYERRVMELLRNSKDKRARKLTKKRVSTQLSRFMARAHVSLLARHSSPL